ncbi:MAG: family 16 glycoside hydrolase [Gemmata sp.]
MDVVWDNYEVRNLNSFDKEKFPRDAAGAVYGFAAPLVNACRKPGEWEASDIRYRAPRRDAAGKITEKGTGTAWFNGKKVQDNAEFSGPGSRSTRSDSATPRTRTRCGTGRSKRRPARCSSRTTATRWSSVTSGCAPQTTATSCANRANNDSLPRFRAPTESWIGALAG